MENSVKVKIHYFLLPTRVNVQESVEQLVIPDGKTVDDVLAGLFNVKSIRLDEGKYSAIEVLGAELYTEQTAKGD